MLGFLKSRDLTKFVESWDVSREKGDSFFFFFRNRDQGKNKVRARIYLVGKKRRHLVQMTIFFKRRLKMGRKVFFTTSKYLV